MHEIVQRGRRGPSVARMGDRHGEQERKREAVVLLVALPNSDEVVGDAQRELAVSLALVLEQDMDGLGGAREPD